MDHDKIDMTILAELSANARVSQTELADRVDFRAPRSHAGNARWKTKDTSGAIRPSLT